ncbi:MAG: hypothetical protein FWC94_04145 [Bacteroidales bacterium]|nr:hypothetical protein [Bacteroidales bacterium]
MQSYKKNLNFSNADNRIEVLSHLGFLVVIGLSAWFHDLRSTFGESAMILFNLINDLNFFSSSVWLSAHWFQNLMTVLAVKSNLSLSVVSLVFSVAPAVFLYAVFLIVYYVFKQKNAGIVLLLLLFGLNQTFFIAVHTPLILAATFYLIIEGFRTVLKKYRKDFCPLIEMGIWAAVCLLIFMFIRVSPNVYQDVIMGTHSFSFFGYFPVAISAFVIPFAMATYLVLFWTYRKLKKPLILLGTWTVLAMILIFIFGQNGLVDVNFELLFFPLVAGLIGFFVLFFGDQLKQSGFRFWILCSLVIFAVFGQLRTLRDFEKRHDFVVQLLKHAPQAADKFALPEHLQQLERYIDPTFLAFETPLIAKLHGLPSQSVFFIPEDNTKTIPSIPDRAFNSSYFHFSSPNYIIQKEPFIRRTLYESFAVDTITATGNGVQFALTISPRPELHRGDSVSLSVLRKGSDFGHLVISDNLRINTRLWLSEQHVSEPDSAGWQKLTTNFLIEKTDIHRVYVMNRNYRNEQIYFKNFRVEIWRE